MLKELIRWFFGLNKYQSISAYQIKIAEKLAGNQRLAKLLYYTSDRPFDEPDLNEIQINELYQRHIIPSKPPLKLSDPVTSIYFHLDDIGERDDWLFAQGELEVRIITPHHLMYIKDKDGKRKTRNWEIAQEFQNSTRMLFILSGLNLTEQDQKTAFSGEFDVLELKDENIRILKKFF
ncbi:hypothetical protein [Laceyella putida]|uniref:Uncharacterized protein n=1 Tax=Laceyella putida TaxID=110101 RepID=A0ABW2RS65_9BACL